MKKPFATWLGCLLTPLYLLVFGLLLVLFHPVQVLCRSLGGYGAHKRSVDILNLLIVRSLFILGTDISFRGAGQLPPGRPLIVVANHQSLFDIPPVIWGFRRHHPKFIAKIELGVPGTIPPDDGILDTELGPSGAKQAAAPAAASTIGLPTPLGASDHDEND